MTKIVKIKEWIINKNARQFKSIYNVFENGKIEPVSVERLKDSVKFGIGDSIITNKIRGTIMSFCEDMTKVEIWIAKQKDSFFIEIELIEKTFISPKISVLEYD